MVLKDLLIFPSDARSQMPAATDSMPLELLFSFTRNHGSVIHKHNPAQLVPLPISNYTYQNKVMLGQRLDVLCMVEESCRDLCQITFFLPKKYASFTRTL